MAPHRAGTLFIGLLLTWMTAEATPPRPDHVVIVIEENHSIGQVIGSGQAPFINTLAVQGALFTNFYAITHPSQPNYLQLFSGSNQGVEDNDYPFDLPFSTPNLGAALLATRHRFTGYCEGLPGVGNQNESSGPYVRKHNPWANWQSDLPGTNQLSSLANKPFFTSDGNPRPFFGDANAPTDYSTLPSVSIVVPNLLHDMHDGTIAQADNWLLAQIQAYANWAKTHNSLLILTWDEDESASRNHIPTILYGPMIVHGQYPQTWTLHNLLRTVGDMYGAVPPGSAARVQPIVGCFTTDGPIATRTFRQGVGNYIGAQDTFVSSSNPTTDYGASSTLNADNDPLLTAQILIRFDNLVGWGVDQVPPGVAVRSAKLVMLTGPNAVPSDSSVDSMEAHRMLTSWASDSTWESMDDGVSVDDSEAVSDLDFAVTPNVLDAWAIFDVTPSVQQFADSSCLNMGWVIQPTGSDGWRCYSSEAASVSNRPMLEITYDPTSFKCPGLPSGDTNGDRVTNGADIQGFVNAVLAGSPTAWAICSADFNFDRKVDSADIAAFIAALIGS